MATAQLMNGSDLAREVTARSAARAEEFLARAGRSPCLATVLVGDDPASVTWVQMKQNRSAKAGIESRHVAPGAATTTEQLVALLADLSGDPDVDGILLQHPVPPHVDERAAFEAIAPEKDVDGATMHSFAAMAIGVPGFQSCTPGGSMRLLDAYGVGVEGQHAAVQTAALVTPVPGGVGPMTIAVLLQQTIDAACSRAMI